MHAFLYYLFIQVTLNFIICTNFSHELWSSFQNLCITSYINDTFLIELTCMKWPFNIRFQATEICIFDMRSTLEDLVLWLVIDLSIETILDSLWFIFPFFKKDKRRPVFSDAVFMNHTFISTNKFLHKKWFMKMNLNELKRGVWLN